LFLELVVEREDCGGDVTEGVEVEGVCSRFRGAILNILKVEGGFEGEFGDVVVELR
jgi:hypothetical protein